jgi:hypothetical protein
MMKKEIMSLLPAEITNCTELVMNFLKIKYYSFTNFIMLTWLPKSHRTT